MESPNPPPPTPSPAPPQPAVLRRVIHLDTTLSHHLHNLTQPFLPRSLLKTLEISGDGRLFFPVTLALLLSPLSTATSAIPTFLINLLLGSLLDLIVIGLIKHIVRRPRPVYNKHMFLTFSVDHWSFPSGHSSRVCFIATFVFLSSSLLEEALIQLKYSCGVQFSDKWTCSIILHESAAAKSVTAIFFSWAIMTSVSRILLGRHFVFDVIAGAIMGVLEALFVFWFFNYQSLNSFLR